MSLTQSTQHISAPLRHVSGSTVVVEIEAGDAVIGKNGVVKSFTLTYDDGHVGNYLLDHHEAGMTGRLEDFVTLTAQYGLMLAGDKVVPAHGIDGTVRFARWVALHELSGHLLGWLRSRLSATLHVDDHGYYNMATAELIFLGTIKLV